MKNLCKSIFGLMLCTCWVINLYADVFEVTEDECFIEWCKQQKVTPNNIEWDDDKFQNFVKSDEFQKMLDERFGREEIFEMEGCAIFVPADTSEETKLYIAKKRKYYSRKDAKDLSKTYVEIADNQIFDMELNSWKCFSYTSNMHTERQLCIVALENSVEALETAKSGNDNILNGAKSPIDNSKLSEFCDKLKKLNGDLYLYVYKSPCDVLSQKSRDNGGCVCIDYYKNLLKFFKKRIKIKVFFSIPTINNGFIVGNLENIQKVLHYYLCDMSTNKDVCSWFLPQYKKIVEKGIRLALPSMVNTFIQANLPKREKTADLIFKNAYSTPKEITFRCIL